MKVDRLQTLYRTPHPEKDKSEYYSISLSHKPHTEQAVYFLRETHGWWDEANRKAEISVVTLDPEEGFPTATAASAAYNGQIAHRVTEGFCHSFSRHHDEPVGEYTNLCK